MIKFAQQTDKTNDAFYLNITKGPYTAMQQPQVFEENWKAVAWQYRGRKYLSIKKEA